ncbi:MAG: aminotransferase class I/II-fold pyridoxal phosphate-dependent enzyme [Alphaproteobacteria bacterium]|nr:aminotransferase class I/II-fold pyridoxal phosphate-dependent enzyme [Alphaproteobacteria bacterium]
MAGLYGVKPENLSISRGADEAIVVLTRLFVEPHKDAILITPPTFGMYKVDALAMPAANVVEVPLLKPSYQLDVPGMVTALENNTNIKLVYLTSPNNPTGNLLDEADILAIIEAAEGKAMVVVDETYIEFTNRASLTTRLQDFPHLIILRTLSKSFSLAGLRMGCAISGDADFVALMRAKGLDAYPLPVASVQAALKVCEPGMQKLAAENRRKLLDERARMEAVFKASPTVVNVYPSDANFLLIEMKNAKGFCDHCGANGVILRDFSTYPGTENCVRISIGTPAENGKLAALLQKF